MGLGLVPRASIIMFLLFGFFHKENVFVYYLCNYNLGLRKDVLGVSWFIVSTSLPRAIPSKHNCTSAGACWEGARPHPPHGLDCGCCSRSAQRAERSRAH